MGRIDKGNLRVGGRTLLARLIDVCREAAFAVGESPLDVELALVGHAENYDAPGLRCLADDPPGVGPLGGLRALLDAATRRRREAVALAVDMPRVSPHLVRHLFSSDHAAAVAARHEGWLNPLFARYRPPTVLPVLDQCLRDGQRSGQELLRRLGSQAAILEVPPPWDRELGDWDRPVDVLRR